MSTSATLTICVSLWFPAAWCSDCTTCVPHHRRTRASCLLELDAEAPHAVDIPVGVATDFSSQYLSILVYGMSHYWTYGRDRLPLGLKELRLCWPMSTPVLSKRDAEAQHYSECSELFRRSWRRCKERAPSRWIVDGGIVVICPARRRPPILMPK